jgi:hypothetical protein
MRQPFYCRGTQLDGRIRIVFQNKWDSSHRHALKLTLKCTILVVTCRKKTYPYPLNQNFCRNFRFWKKILQKLSRKQICCENFCENEHFRENFHENENFPENFSRKLSRKRKISRNEILQKLAHFRLLFAFRENEKTVFVSTLNVSWSA